MFGLMNRKYQYIYICIYIHTYSQMYLSMYAQPQSRHRIFLSPQNVLLYLFTVTSWPLRTPICFLSNRLVFRVSCKWVLLWILFNAFTSGSLHTAECTEIRLCCPMPHLLICFCFWVAVRCTGNHGLFILRPSVDTRAASCLELLWIKLLWQPHTSLCVDTRFHFAWVNAPMWNWYVIWWVYV